MRAALLALLAALHSCWALDDGLALRPPLGINTWNVSMHNLSLFTALFFCSSVPRTTTALEDLALR